VALYLLVVPSGVCKRSINPFTRPFPVYSHTYYVTIYIYIYIYTHRNMTNIINRKSDTKCVS
jgi:hypothetical protein